MKPYPQMTVDEFIEYISNVMDEYPYEDYYPIFGTLCNDDVSSDDELGGLLFKYGTPPLLIGKLMEVREYFWDFRYAKEITG